MPWIVKNISNGYVTLNDVKISFAPGEQMDLDNNVNMLSVGGKSDNLAFLINKGMLEVIQDDRIQPMAFSAPNMDHIRSAVQEAMAGEESPNIRDEVQDIVSKAMRTISKEIGELKSNQDDKLRVVDLIANEVTRLKEEMGSKAELNQEVIGLITELKDSIFHSIGQSPSKPQGLDVDEITAQIHATRHQSKDNLGGKIEVEEAQTDQSVDDVADLLRKTRKKAKN